MLPDVEMMKSVMEIEIDNENEMELGFFRVGEK